ncbi:MAG: DUF5688 family protein [Lachnospiraceae bacterium]|nr:DUF5688 family protein [Lachnospiraceae bacterium]
MNEWENGWEEEGISLDEFCGYVAAHIKDYLPDSYQNWEVQVADVTKLNGIQKGLTVRDPDANTAPVIYLDNYYHLYQEDRELSGLMEQIAGMQVGYDSQKRGKYDYAGNDIYAIMDMVGNWEAARDNVVLDAVGCERNADLLADRPHMRLDNSDIAAVYKIEIGKDEDGTYSIPITNEMQHRYGISMEELHDQALKNSEDRYPAQYLPMESFLMASVFGYLDPKNNMESLGELMPLGNGPLILSNQELLRGACTLFYPGVLDQVAERYPQGFYLAPSSVHEILIIPKNGLMSIEEADQMIQEVNQVAVSPEEQLSDLVHEYDPVSRTIYAPTLVQYRKLAQPEVVDLLPGDLSDRRPDGLSNLLQVPERAYAPEQTQRDEQQKTIQKQHAGR